MKLLALASLSAALVGCSAETYQPTVPSGNDEPLRVAAWNIEHLAAEPGQGCEPRTPEGYELVSEVISEIDADIWLLQEVENEQALKRVFGESGWVFHMEDRADTGPGPECWGRDDGARLRMQRTAIAIREGIEHTRGEDLAALDVGGRGFLRHGVNISVQHQGGLVDIMSVHLKSGCFSGDGSDDCPRLFAQVPVLEDWIDQQSADGSAVIVGGDFNRRLARAGDSVWSDLNDGDPVALSIAGNGRGPQCNPRYREYIDFVVMNEAASRRFAEGSFAETTFAEGRRASDHCPIAVTLR
ncbi:endonuclease/exonuclease/phosphatase family protein [Maricaulaceae bacterium EIL42A08]|nr:endonuclease/exonuclease/phosphatase family protein [Maricaulaceae bacterium EIL42A08]